MFLMTKIIPESLNTFLFRTKNKVLRKLGIKRDNIDYKSYWEKRYKKGGHSGKGSYGILAKYKAEVVNSFIKKNSIKTVIEFGSGDGNQIKLMDYKNYIGLDISQSAIDRCNELFQDDPTKKFVLYDPTSFKQDKRYRSDLVLSLDVLYHILDDKDYSKTIEDMLSVADKYIIFYTTLFDDDKKQFGHIKSRDVRKELKKYKNLEIIKIEKNKYPKESHADFVFCKIK